MRRLAWKLKAVLIFICMTCSSLLIGQITLDFYALQTEGCQSLQTSFIPQASSSSGDITTYHWDLDGTISELESPGKIYAQPGFYSICLTVGDAAGNTASLCKDDYIKVYNNPQPDFNIDISSGCLPLEVSFTDASWVDNGFIAEWIWDIGGTTGVLQTSDPNQIIKSEYTHEGQYSASLTVVDNHGCVNSIYKDNIIEVVGLPDIQVSTTNAIGCDFPLEIDFVNLNIEANTDYFWDFGNGQTHSGPDPPVVIYDSPSDYIIRIQASNTITGCSSTLELEEYVSPGGGIEFDFEPKVLCSEGAVFFEDESFGSADSLIWDFGDGQTSTMTSPSHHYSNPGTYEIRLTRYVNGCSASRTSNHVVQVRELPLVSLDIEEDAFCGLPVEVLLQAEHSSAVSFDWQVVTPGSTMQFNSANPILPIEEFGEYIIELSVADAYGCRSGQAKDTIVAYEFTIELPDSVGGCAPLELTIPDIGNQFHSIVSWDWNVYTDPPQHSTSSNPTFVLQDTGQFDLRLVIENEAGCRDTINKERFLRAGNQPTAEFDAFPLEVCTQENIQLYDESAGAANSWLWIVADSSFFTGKGPNFSFSQPARLDVELLVAHNGCESYLKKEDFINVIGPGINGEETYNCDRPLDVFFEEIVLEDHYDTYWEIKSGIQILDEKQESSFTYTFPDTGSFTTTIYAYDPLTDCHNWDSINVEVVIPEAEYSIEVLSHCDPYKALIKDHSQSAISWSYNSFGGFLSDPLRAEPSYIIYEPGEYPAPMLQVTDIHGCTDDFQIPDPIFVNQLYPDFIDPDPICRGDSLELFDLSSSFYGNIHDWYWDIEGGTYVSSGKNPQFSIDSSGVFDVKLVIEGDYGCIDSIEKRNILEVILPEIQFSADTLGCTWAAIQFVNAAYRSNYTYEWNFGDGMTSGEAFPVHQYENEGVYTICLTAKDEMGCINEVCHENYIRIANPKASFEGENLSGECPPLIVNFENHSINAKKYEWDFGDASGVSNLESPSHVYIEPGLFDVKLTAILTESCRSEITIEDMISLQGPVGEFNYTLNEQCAPVEVNFSASSTDLFTYIWDYGNGVLDSIEGKQIENNNSYIYESAGSFIPSLILIDDNNCQRSFSGEEINLEELKLGFYPTDTILCGTPAVIRVEGSIQSSSDLLQLEWFFSGATQEFSTEMNPEVVYENFGEYGIQLIGRNEACADTVIKETVFKIVPFPEIELAEEINLCYGDSIELGIRSNGPYIYNWDESSPGLSDYQASNPIAFPTQNTIYEVDVLNEFGCQIQDQIAVNVIHDETDLLPDARMVCEQQEVRLSVEYGNDPKWIIGENLNCLDCYEVVVKPTQDGDYAVQVTNDDGCLIRDTIRLELLGDEDVEAGTDQLICIEDPAFLAGEGIGEANWFPAGIIEHNGQLETMAFPQESQWIYLELSNDNGNCILMDSLWIEVESKAQITAIGDSLCPGQDGILLADGIAHHWQWYRDGIYVHSGKEMPIYQAQESRSYSVYGELGSCPGDSVEVDLLVHPHIDVLIPDLLFFVEGQQLGIELNPTPTTMYEYEWTPTDLVDCDHCEDVNVLLTKDTSIWLMIVDEFGCELRDTIELRKIERCPGLLNGIYVPNAFSPNNDGYNDVFEIESPLVEKVQSFRVFDRWGEQIFDGGSVDDSWDGNFEGRKMPAGIYVYVIQIYCEWSDEVIAVWGDVTLVR